MLTEGVLRVLADGQYHSGRDLAEQFCVSRTAISNVVRKLCEQGLTITAAPKRGYQLAGGFDALSVEVLRGYFPEHINIETHFSLPSTNQYCLEKARTAANKPHLIFAECQTAGRGRRGREWCSPLGGNLYGSLLWQFESGVSHLAGLSLAVGVCIAEVLTALDVPGVRLKWPNDVLIGNRKLAGILIECQGDLSGPTTVVVGVGLNIAMRTPAEAAITQPWVDLASVMPVTPKRNALAGECWRAIVQCLSEYPNKGLSAFYERWLQFDSLRQQEVTIYNGAEVLHGECHGIDTSGCLLVRCGDEIKSFSSGDVSVRALA